MPATLPQLNVMTSVQAITEMLLKGGVGSLNGDLVIPFSFTTANNAVLFTVPAGYRMHIWDSAWEPLVSLTGGASSAIGVNSSNAGYNTAGDLLGGAAGDVAAGLTAVPATPIKRTTGTKVAAGATTGMVVLVAGDTIKFNQIVSQFTAGNGLIHLFFALVPTQ